MIKGCCMVPGESCFTKVDGYGQCRKKCPKGWNCTKVTEAKPYLAFPCAKEFKQCGGNGFKGNPCCAAGLVCHGDQPKFYQQCTNKDDVKRLEKKAAKKSVATPGSKKSSPKSASASTDSDDDDDDDAGDLGLSDVSNNIDTEQDAHAKLPGFYVLGAAFMVAAGAVAFAARKQAGQRGARHQFLSAEDGIQEEPLQPENVEG